jgi:transcriptional regulator with XRE-family HTH domain
MSRTKTRECIDRAAQRELDYVEYCMKLDMQDFVLSRFLEQQKLGLTQREVARRLGWSRQRVHQLLLEPPVDFRVATIARLLFAICREAFVPGSKSVGFIDLLAPASEVTHPLRDLRTEGESVQNWKALRERGLAAAGFVGRKESDLPNAASEIEITLYRPITAQPLVADKK